MRTSASAALAGMLGVFAEFKILRERVKARVAHARAKGKSPWQIEVRGKKVDEARRLS